MEALLNKISDSGLDPARVSGEEAIIFWNHIRRHIATSPQQIAQCLLISAEIRFKLHQRHNSIDELKEALDYLTLPEDIELILEVKNTLANRLIESGDFHAALNEYIHSSTLAVENGHIDAYVFAVLGMGDLCAAYGDHNRALRYYQKIDSIDHAINSRSLRLRYKLRMLTSYIELKRTTAAHDLIKECEELSILVSDKALADQRLLLQAKLYRQNEQMDNALECLAKVQYSLTNGLSTWLKMRLELAEFLSKKNKPHIARWILESAQQRAKFDLSPMVDFKLCQSLSDICQQQQNFENALSYQKSAYRIESDLMKKIPISELGPGQLRRLARFELQLKLILSELENRELKETTESQKHTVAQLQQDVFTDPLTSLHNRRWLDVKLKDLLLHDVPFALVVIDIDHFKSINDELSHLVGDKAIVNVSDELANYFKFRGASCVRFGGEEFLVILEKVTLEQAEMHAENYRERIFSFNWQNILGERGLTVSLGVTLYRQGENTQRTFYRADKALYRAKANGRNQVCCE